MKNTHIIYKLLLTIYSWLPFKREICLLIRSLNIPAGKFYKDLRFRGVFSVRFHGNKFKMRNYKHTTLENEIFWFGVEKGWERVSIDLWEKLSKSAEVIFDIGANTGIYSLISKVANPSSKVIAFEPSRRVYEKLTENIRLNSFDIIPEQLAISNYNGEVAFYDTYEEHQYSASLSIEMKNFIIDTGLKINEYSVASQTLKEYIEQHQIQKIDLMKIDVELHEYEVLEGFGEYINRFKPSILIEVLSDEMAKKIEPFFLNNEYLFYSIDENNNPEKRDHLTKSGCFNYLICRKEIASFLNL